MLVEAHLEDLEDRRSLSTLAGWGEASAGLHHFQRVWQGTITADQAPASFLFFFYKAGTAYCHPPLHPLPLTAQMAGCSLVRFLWCMLWWRISSSERANFFWQLDQRQVKGFSPDEEGTDKEKNRRNVCFRVTSPLGAQAWGFIGYKLKR